MTPHMGDGSPNSVNIPLNIDSKVNDAALDALELKLKRIETRMDRINRGGITPAIDLQKAQNTGTNATKRLTEARTEEYKTRAKNAKAVIKNKAAGFVVQKEKSLFSERLKDSKIARDYRKAQTDDYIRKSRDSSTQRKTNAVIAKDSSRRSVIDRNIARDTNRGEVARSVNDQKTLNKRALDTNRGKVARSVDDQKTLNKRALEHERQIGRVQMQHMRNMGRQELSHMDKLKRSFGNLNRATSLTNGSGISGRMIGGAAGGINNVSRFLSGNLRDSYLRGQYGRFAGASSIDDLNRIGRGTGSIAEDARAVSSRAGSLGQRDKVGRWIGRGVRGVMAPARIGFGAVKAGYYGTKKLFGAGANILRSVGTVGALAGGAVALPTMAFLGEDSGKARLSATMETRDYNDMWKRSVMSTSTDSQGNIATKYGSSMHQFARKIAADYLQPIELVYQALELALGSILMEKGGGEELARSLVAAAANLAMITREGLLELSGALMAAYSTFLKDGKKKYTFAEIANVLLGAAQVGNRNVVDMARAMGDMAQAGIRNFDLKDTFAFLITMTYSGFNPEEAGTGIKNVVLGITRGSKVKATQAWLKEHGLNKWTAADLSKIGFVGMIKTINTALKKKHGADWRRHAPSIYKGLAGRIREANPLMLGVMKVDMMADVMAKLEAVPNTALSTATSDYSASYFYKTSKRQALFGQAVSDFGMAVNPLANAALDVFTDALRNTDGPLGDTIKYFIGASKKTKGGRVWSGSEAQKSASIWNKDNNFTKKDDGFRTVWDQIFIDSRENMKGWGKELGRWIWSGIYGEAGGEGGGGGDIKRIGNFLGAGMLDGMLGRGSDPSALPQTHSSAIDEKVNASMSNLDSFFNLFGGEENVFGSSIIKSLFRGLSREGHTLSGGASMKPPDLAKLGETISAAFSGALSDVQFEIVHGVDPSFVHVVPKRQE